MQGWDYCVKVSVSVSVVERELTEDILLKPNDNNYSNLYIPNL